jgi:threonine/homoserine/homoserine lactone efflux protein
MDTAFLLKGGLIGLSIAAPVGPIGVLCIRRTLAEGRLAGLVSGLGAATADAVYGCIAGLGLSFVSAFLVRNQGGLQAIGGLFLCYLGIRTFLATPAQQAAVARSKGLSGNYASTFLLTLTNPMTILSFTAIFAGLGLANTAGDYLSASLLVLGVFVGSALWWLLLSSGIGLFRARFPTAGLVWVNRMAGVVIAGFGVGSLAGLL